MKIGLFGGTFDPIHLGHAALARRVFDDFKLDELVFIPAKLPPHKDRLGATAEQRYDMARLTAEALGAGFCASDYELVSDGLSLTHRTVSHWRKKHPEDAIFFITGTDIFASIGQWYNWLDLFNQCNFIVVNRPGMDFAQLIAVIPDELRENVIRFEDYKCSLQGKIILYNMPPVSISSTFIRDGLTQAKEYLLDSVYKYIVDKKLY